MSGFDLGDFLQDKIEDVAAVIFSGVESHLAAFGSSNPQVHACMAGICGVGAGNLQVAHAAENGGPSHGGVRHTGNVQRG